MFARRCFAGSRSGDAVPAESSTRSTLQDECRDRVRNEGVDHALVRSLSRRFDAWFAERSAKLITVILTHRRTQCLQVLNRDDKLYKLGLEAAKILDDIALKGDGVEEWRPKRVMDDEVPVVHATTEVEGNEDSVPAEEGCGGPAPAVQKLPFPLAKRGREESMHREALMAGVPSHSCAHAARSVLARWWHGIASMVGHRRSVT